MNFVDKINEPLRVLHVIGSLDRGGAETMIMNLYRNINRDKVQFDFLLSSETRGQYEEEIESLGGKIYRIDRFTGKNIFSYYRKCVIFFKNHPEYSIVHGHIGSSAALYLLAAKKAGCYVIAHSHNAKSIFSLHSLAFSFFSYPTRYIADQLFGCSTEAGIARYGQKKVKGPKYKNFNNGIDLEQFYFDKNIRFNIRNELKIPHEAIVIGTVGRITKQKNPNKILEVFENLVKDHSDCFCLWIGTGEDEERIEKEIISRGLSKKIKLLGVRNDIPQILQAFDSFLFPSLWEGLPVTIVEAQAAGLPVIISNRISKEVEMTPLMFWMDIDSSSKKWADICYQKAVEYLNERCKYNELIKYSGYDIKETSDWISAFYLSHIPEKNNIHQVNS